VFGVLRLFHSGPRLKAVRATCDTAYPGTQLDRTVCLVGPYLLDVYRVTGAKEQTVDLPLHGLGEASTDSAVSALSKNPFSGLGYTHLKDIRQLTNPSGLVRAQFVDDDRKLEVLQIVPDGSEVYLARDPSKGKDKTSCLLTRVHAASTRFVTVLSPTRGENPVQDVAARSVKGELWVEIVHRDGIDRLILPDRLDGAVRLECLNKRGAVVARERANADK
jgi:hypothetical protein